MGIFNLCVMKMDSSIPGGRHFVSWCEADFFLATGLFYHLTLSEKLQVVFMKKTFELGLLTTLKWVHSAIQVDFHRKKSWNIGWVLIVCFASHCLYGHKWENTVALAATTYHISLNKCTRRGGRKWTLNPEYKSGARLFKQAHLSGKIR